MPFPPGLAEAVATEVQVRRPELVVAQESVRRTKPFGQDGGAAAVRRRLAELTERVTPPDRWLRHSKRPDRWVQTEPGDGGTYGFLRTTESVFHLHGDLTYGAQLPPEMREVARDPANVKRVTWAKRGKQWECLEPGVQLSNLRDRSFSLDRRADVLISHFSVSAPGEPVRKGGGYSYKNENKKERQAASLADLQAEIAKKRKDLQAGLKWADFGARFSPSYEEALRAVLWPTGRAPKVGGPPEEVEKVWKDIVLKHRRCFWIDGCAAPCVQNHKIHFSVRPNAVPVARQPIPVSPFDDMRVEYHIEENVVLGKLQKIDTVREGVPEWSTPVFVVDQDAKGVLGRMVCAYGPVNQRLVLPSFPSADPERAFRMMAGKHHHSVVDAIWGYTQFLLDEDTQKLLVICIGGCGCLSARRPRRPTRRGMWRKLSVPCAMRTVKSS